MVRRDQVLLRLPVCSISSPCRYNRFTIHFMIILVAFWYVQTIFAPRFIFKVVQHLEIRCVLLRCCGVTQNTLQILSGNHVANPVYSSVNSIVC